jgi:hypothetical protein
MFSAAVPTAGTKTYTPAVAQARQASASTAAPYTESSHSGWARFVDDSSDRRRIVDGWWIRTARIPPIAREVTKVLRTELEEITFAFVKWTK